MTRGGLTKRERLKLMTWLSVSVGIVGIIVGSLFYSDPNSPNWNPDDYTTYEIWAVAVAPLCICFFIWVIVATNSWLHQAMIATTPFPTPAEIYAHLESQYGHPPTAEEVAAMQQMLVHRRNEALVNTGIGLGALYLVARNHHRS